MLAERKSESKATDEDFAKTALYENLTTELLAYKRQRDDARTKAGRYKAQWKETCNELERQTSKFELLAEEFRKLLGVDGKMSKKSRG